MTAALIDYLLFSAVILSYLLTYNVPAPSHIIRSVLVSCVRGNPAMTAEVTPEGLYNHNLCTMMWHYTAPWMFGTRVIEHFVRWGVRIPPREGASRLEGWVSHCKIQAVSTYGVYCLMESIIKQ